MECMNAIQQEFKKMGITFYCNEPLAQHTSFQIGGPADLFCTPSSIAQLADIIRICKKNNVRYYLLGNGSNLLFSDSGFRGVVISTTTIAPELVVDETGFITADAGRSLKEICEAAAEHSLTGLEFAYGIPGSLGGAVYMNAGAYGGEMKDVLYSVDCIDDAGEIRTLPLCELELGYRTSIFERTGWCVLRAKIQLKKGDASQIHQTMSDLMQRRKDKQPLEYPSAGSAFKRPVGAFAGGLIDQCGLRGFQVGGAAISQKHCGFIVNMGNATCQNVLDLANQVSEIVEKQTGFKLEKEIRVVK